MSSDQKIGPLLALYLMGKYHMNCYTIRNPISEMYENGEVWCGYIH